MEYGVALVALAFLVAGALLGWLIGAYSTARRLEKEIPALREDAVKKSRQVLAGQFSEQLAPYLPDFPFNPTEVRFLGKPVDFVVFRGLDEREPTEIVFVEVKSGNAQLSPTERKIKQIIAEKKISFIEYRIPKDLTDDRKNSHQPN
ncbi:Endonuclease related to archaeal Holliday junction resolvase [uncultured archaeon]|nr:Endonuclease related to archaeal Holliday junction resolvase [uncultured archaeon]